MYERSEGYNDRLKGQKESGWQQERAAGGSQKRIRGVVYFVNPEQQYGDEYSPTEKTRTQNKEAKRRC